MPILECKGGRAHVVVVECVSQNIRPPGEWNYQEECQPMDAEVKGDIVNNSWSYLVTFDKPRGRRVSRIARNANLGHGGGVALREQGDELNLVVRSKEWTYRVRVKCEFDSFFPRRPLLAVLYSPPMWSSSPKLRQRLDEDINTNKKRERK